MELFDASKYRGKRVCVALSGGVDSVCLLHGFYTAASDMGITLSAIHVEHGIRGEESVRDMEFCKTLCAEWGVPLHIRRIDVPAVARKSGDGIEECARMVRYSVFASLLEGEADLVATAHHLDDVAETVLFRLARGTGPGGMRAITERPGIVRPLLALTRAQIEAYARANNLPHVEDSTNSDETYARNYIRRVALPAFEKVHDGAKRHLTAFAALVAEEDAYLSSLAAERIVHIFGEEWVPVDLPDVLFRRASLMCMRQTAESASYTRANLEEVVKLRSAQSGRRVRVPDGGKGTLYAVREGKYIAFVREYAEPEEKECAELPFSAQTGLYLSPALFVVQECFGEGPAAQTPAFDEGWKRPLRVDLDAFPAGCVVRARREGDRITPYHAPRKTLKKFLTDRKISARFSKKLPVIAKGSEVYVVVGVEISEQVKVTESTKRIAVIR